MVFKKNLGEFSVNGASAVRESEAVDNSEIAAVGTANIKARLEKREIFFVADSRKFAASVIEPAPTQFLKFINNSLDFAVVV